MSEQELDIRAVERKYMEATPETWTWSVDGVGNHGPVTMTLQVPQVTITDAAGNSITVTPKQAETISSRLTDIYCCALDYTE